MRKTWTLVLAALMVLTLTFGSFAESTVAELPRNETLYFGGQQWGTVVTWNPVGTNQNNALAYNAVPAGSRTLMYETLYMFNFLDGALVPLLADGDFVENEALTETTVKIKEAAKWSDGTPVTAHDVVKTWDISVQIMNGTGSNYGSSIAGIEAVDDKTILIKSALTEDGKPVNPLKVKDFLVGTYIAQKAWIETLEERLSLIHI